MTTTKASLVSLSFVQGTSDKFYNVFTVGQDVTTQYGRTGTYGTFTPRKPSPDEAKAALAAQKAAAGKVAKGYVVTKTAERDFEGTPTDADLDKWAGLAPSGAVTAVTVPQERAQSAHVAAVNASDDEIDPLVMSTVRFALGAPAAFAAKPGQVLPMLAHNAEPGDLESMLRSPAWVMQPKLDGDRVMVEVTDGQVTAYGRNGQAKVSNVGRAMLAPFRSLTEGRYVFDGEVVGRTLWLFDMPVADGYLDANSTFEERLATLHGVRVALGGDPTVIGLVSTAVTEDDKRALLASAEADRKEGVMFRRVHSSYRTGRSSDLLRHKFVKTVDAVVISSGSQPTTTYTARFVPQAWVNDYAVDVDPEGPQEWTVSAASVADAERIIAEANESEDAESGVLDNDDRLMGDPAAPQWVRDWHGPFDIWVTAVTVPATGKQSAALAVYDHDGQQVRIGSVTTIGKGGPGGIRVGQVVEVQFLYTVNPDAPVLFQPRILRVRTDKQAAECSTDQLIGTHTNREV